MRVLIVAGALALAGCAGGGIAGYERPVVGGGGGLPVTVARASQDVVTPPGRRMLGLAVRTYDRTVLDQLDETVATCTVEAGAFSAVLQTPGRLLLPDLGPDAPPVTARCESGQLVGAARVEPDYLWAESGSTGLQRALWGGGRWDGGVKSGPMRYPDLAIALEPRS